MHKHTCSNNNKMIKARKKKVGGRVVLWGQIITISKIPKPTGNLVGEVRLELKNSQLVSF